MVVTITTPAGNTIGPGALVTVASNLPDPGGAHWVLSIGDQPITIPWLQLSSPVTGQQFQFPLLAGPHSGVGVSTDTTQDIPDDHPATIRADWSSQSTGVDTGSKLTTWVHQGFLGQQADLIARFQTTGTGGGLTPQQDTTLTETWQGSFPSIAIDSLLTQNLTPGGPSPGPVNANLTTPVFGVIVRIANVPPELLPQTPDGDYWIPTLAVVRIFRGSDLWMRVPIHTSNKIVPLENEGLVSAVVEALTNTWMLNLSVQVTFAAGVTGTVLLMNLP